MHLESGKHDSIRTEQLTRSGTKSKLIEAKSQFRGNRKEQYRKSQITVEVTDVDPTRKAKNLPEKQSTFA